MEAAGHIVDLKHEHLTAMMVLRQQTQSIHHQLLPDIFPELINEKYEWRAFCSYMPRWYHFFRRRMQFGVGWVDGDSLGGYLLYFDYAIPEDGSGKRKWARLISDIAVKGVCQKSGIASLLLAKVRERAQRRNISAIYANVWNGNEASAAFFEKAGFSIQMNYFCLPISDNSQQQV
jgi:GNAT superfamily N-acetyltransferase